MSAARRAYVNSGNPCCEESAGGWFCTLVAGHAGDHSAGGTRDEDGMCVVFDTWANGPDEGDKIAAAVAAARADVLAKLEALHAPYRIYDECGHEHTYAESDVREIDEIGLVCSEGLMYVICRDCCCDHDGNGSWQREECADHHRHEKTPGAHMCSTRALIADLGGTDD